jgi:hypothetical protein
MSDESKPAERVPGQMPTADQMLCTGCNQWLPRSPEYFDRDNAREGGLRPICKQCRSKDRELRRMRDLETQVKHLDERALSLLDAVTRTGSDVPHVAEVFQRIVEVFEGAGGFAQHFMAQYLASVPGSSTRQKMLDMVVKLAIKTSDSGAAQIPIEMLSDEDLQVQFEKGMRKYVPRIVDHDGEVKEAS